MIQRVYALKESMPADINSIILDTYSKTMQRYLAEKDLIPAGQLIELPYEDLIQKPMESMRKIYETIHLDDFGYCENKLKSFVHSQKSFVRLQHEIAAEERKIVTEKLEPFIRHWNYPL